MSIDNTERPKGLWDDADLVIYTTDAEEAEADPETEWGEELGILSFSLWARFEDKMTEIQIYGRSETGMWFSMNAERLNDSCIQSGSDRSDRNSNRTEDSDI